MNPEKFEISRELAQTLINYLVNQPFKDVSKLVGDLMQLKPILPEVVKGPENK